MTKPARDQYEEKYRRVYAAGVPLVSARGFGESYRAFLSGRKERGRLLEFGCGEGHAAAMAAELGYAVLGIDIARSAIAKARQLYGQGGSGRQIRFEVGDVVEAEWLDSDAFEVAVNIGCLHVIEDEGDARRHVGHAFRVLKPAGLAFFQNQVSPDEAGYWFPSMGREIDRWRERIASARSSKTESYPVDGRQISVEVPSRLGSVHRDLRTQVSLLTSAGFRIEHVSVHTSGVNSPFEAVIIGSKP